MKSVPLINCRCDNRCTVSYVLIQIMILDAFIITWTPQADGLYKAVDL